MSDPRIIVIGIHGHGASHVRNALATGRLVAVIDPRPPAAESEAVRAQVPWYASLDEFLASGDQADVAVLCTPLPTHAPMTTTLLRAGLDGIKQRMSLPQAAEEDLYHVDPRARQLETLPGSLAEALAELQRDDVIVDALGPHVLERFVEAKTQEWESYRLAVSQWELERYLPIY